MRTYTRLALYSAAAAAILAFSSHASAAPTYDPAVFRGGIDGSNTVNGVTMAQIAQWAQNAIPASQKGSPSGVAPLDSLGYASSLNVLTSGATSPVTLATRFASIVGPYDFGAACDGSTDDHAALSTMFSYAMSTGVSIRFPAGHACLNNTPITVASGSGTIVDIDLNNASVVTTNGSNFLVFDGSNIPKMSGFNLHGGTFFDTKGSATVVRVINPKEFFGYYQSSIYQISVPNKDPRVVNGSVVSAGAASLFYGQNIGHYSIYRNYGSFSGSFVEVTGVAEAAGNVGADQYTSDSDVYDNSVVGTGSETSIAVRIHDHVQGIFVSRNRFLVFGYGVYMAPADHTGSEGMEVIDNGLGVRYGGIWIQGGLNIISRNNLQSASGGVDASFIGYNIGSATAPSVYSVFTDNGANSLGGSSSQTTPVYQLYVSDGSVITGNQASGIWRGACMNIYPSGDSSAQSIVSNNNCWQAGAITVSGAWNGSNNIYNAAVGSSTIVNVSNVHDMALTSVTPPAGVFYINGTLVSIDGMLTKSLTFGAKTTPAGSTTDTYTNLAYVSADQTTHNISIGDFSAATTYGGQLIMQTYTKANLLTNVKGVAGGMVLCSDCNAGAVAPVYYSGSSWMMYGSPTAVE